MANRYTQQRDTYMWSESLSGLSQYTALGTEIGSAFGGPLATWLGAGLGFVLGAILGPILGGYKWNAQMDAQIDMDKANRRITTRERNSLLRGAKQYIGSTRNAFDAAYGTGMYDRYSNLLAKVYGLDTGNTLSDVLSNASYDQFAGQIESRLSGIYSGEGGMDYLNGVLSKSQLAGDYMDWLEEAVRASDGQFGLQMNAAAIGEKHMYQEYMDSLSTNLASVRTGIENMFANQRSDEVEAALSLGEAQATQAASGIRQTGSGRNLEILEELRNDLRNAAYASAAEQALTQLEAAMKEGNRDLLYSIYQNRNSVAQATKSAIDSMIDAMNQAHQQLGSAYLGASEREGVIDDLSRSMKEADDAKLMFENGKRNDLGPESLGSDLFASGT